jgi:alpha-ketoglutarate-dependent taurine dioxygenase
LVEIDMTEQVSNRTWSSALCPEPPPIPRARDWALGAVAALLLQLAMAFGYLGAMAMTETKVAALLERGWMLVPEVERGRDNAALLALARGLGSISLRALPHRSGLVENEGVQRVETLASPFADQFGKPPLSGHHVAFPLHSDEAFAALPCRYVLLHCWRADPAGGGASPLATRERIEAAIDDETRQALQSLRLDYPFGRATTLSPALLRYNRSEIESLLQRRDLPLSPATRTWLDRFDSVFAAAAESVVLAPGDLLLIYNHRTRHGRTAFPAGSPRLLKRVLVDARR